MHLSVTYKKVLPELTGHVLGELIIEGEGLVLARRVELRQHLPIKGMVIAGTQYRSLEAKTTSKTPWQAPFDVPFELEVDSNSTIFLPGNWGKSLSKAFRSAEIMHYPLSLHVWALVRENGEDTHLTWKEQVWEGESLKKDEK